MKLTNQSKQIEIVNNVVEAKGIWQRMKGLLGRKQFCNDSTMWFQNCNSIHTYFMQFPIDVVFVDKNLKVKALFKSVQPWRLILPVWSARSTFEFYGGVLQNRIEVGDQLNVGD